MSHRDDDPPTKAPYAAAPALILAEILPGMWVRHPDMPDWGEGQVQSVIGTRVTVGFEHAGKQLINAAVVTLVDADADPGRHSR